MPTVRAQTYPAVGRWAEYFVGSGKNLGALTYLCPDRVSTMAPYGPAVRIRDLAQGGT